MRGGYVVGVRRSTVYVSFPEQRLTKCFNSLSIPSRQHLAVLDNGADTCVIGMGWKIISEDSIRRANVYGFDKNDATKFDLPIVSAVAILVNNGKEYLVKVNEAVYNETSSHTLLSEYQMRDFGIKVESTAIKHGGKQIMELNGEKIFLVLKIS